MGAARQKEKSQTMAADLIRRGYPHGRRQSTPRHANYPATNEVGSAAYRRLQESKRRGSSTR